MEGYPCYDPIDQMVRQPPPTIEYDLLEELDTLEEFEMLAMVSLRLLAAERFRAGDGGSKSPSISTSQAVILPSADPEAHRRQTNYVIRLWRRRRERIDKGWEKMGELGRVEMGDDGRRKVAIELAEHALFAAGVGNAMSRPCVQFVPSEESTLEIAVIRTVVRRLGLELTDKHWQVLHVYDDPWVKPKRRKNSFLQVAAGLRRELDGVGVEIKEDDQRYVSCGLLRLLLCALDGEVGSRVRRRNFNTLYVRALDWIRTNDPVRWPVRERALTSLPATFGY